MTRSRIIAVLCFGIWAGLFFGWLMAAIGMDSPDMMALSGKVLLAAQTDTSYEFLVSQYPPLPFLTFFLIQSLPVSLPGGPLAVGTGFLAGIMATTWLASFRRKRFGWVGSAAIALALLLNPLTLWAASTYPSTLFIVAGVWTFGYGLFELRRELIASHMVTLGLGLMIVALSVESGVAAIMAALPFILIAFPARLSARAPGGLILTILFPAIGTIAAIAFINWIFTGSPTAFLPDIAGANSFYRETPVFSRFSVFNLTAALLALIILSAPLVLAFIVIVYRRTALSAPAAMLLLSLLIWGVGGELIDGSFDPALPVCAFGAVSALIIARWPSDRWPVPSLAVLVPLGVLGSAVSVFFLDDRTPAGAPNDDLRQVARTLPDNADILLDAGQWPELIAYRGSAEGIVAYGTPGFQRVLLTYAPEQRYIIVPSPDLAQRRQDRLSNAIPGFWTGKLLLDYELVYDSRSWRVYERSIQPKRAKLR